MCLKSLAVAVFLAVLFDAGEAWTRSDDMKKPCVNCHTMHNSQGGVGVTGNSVLNDALLSVSCLGCHTGVNTGSTDAVPKTPKILHLSVGSPPSPPYMTTGTENGHDTLAGGDFGWVANAGNDLKGHNVVGIATGGTITCAGAGGCHGNLAINGELAAMYQTHHSVEPQPDPRFRDGISLTTSYRWLNEVSGYEDPDYELSVESGTVNHNQYKGIARLSEGESTSSSISNFCARCHGDFHTGSNPMGISDDASAFGSDPWIRHPVDFAMPLTGEYASYGKPGVGGYNITSPLGSTIVTAAMPTVTGAGDTIITCISCHRAHGSPYNYNLRWDYKNWPGGATAYNGCGDCHTLKN